MSWTWESWNNKREIVHRDEKGKFCSKEGYNK